MAEPNAAAAGDTARQDWFAERVAHALKIKVDKFKKMMAGEEASRPMVDFFTLPECQRVFVAEGTKDVMCFETPPPSHKKKLVYFIKLHKVAITAENVKDEVLHGDLTPQVLQHLFDTTSEVYLPLVSNTHNQQGLPEVIVKDVMEYFHRLVRRTAPEGAARGAAAVAATAAMGAAAAAAPPSPPRACPSLALALMLAWPVAARWGLRQRRWRRHARHAALSGHARPRTPMHRATPCATAPHGPMRRSPLCLPTGTGGALSGLLSRARPRRWPQSM